MSSPSSGPSSTSPFGPVALPYRSERRFAIHLYWANQGLLLLRSGRAAGGGRRLDLLFRDVHWVAAPTSFEGLVIERSARAELPAELRARVLDKEPRLVVYRLGSQGASHWLLAGSVVTLAEDEGGLSEDSALLPGFDFSALQSRD